MDSPGSALVSGDLIDSPDFDPKSAVVLEASESPAPTTSVGPVSGRVETESPGYLLLTDANSSSWSARIDRRKTPIFHADYAFRAVYIDARSSSPTFSSASRSERR